MEMIKVGKYKIQFVIIALMVNISSYVYSQAILNESATLIPKGESRSYMLTNSCSVYLFAETGGANTSSFNGLSVKTYKCLEDYAIEVNGELLIRERAESSLYPSKLIRKYNDYNLEEEITLLDTLPVLQVHFSSDRQLTMSLVPIISKNEKSKLPQQIWSPENKILFLGKTERLVSNDQQEFTEWTGIFTYPESEFIDFDTNNHRVYPGYDKKDNNFPGKLNFFLDGKAFIFVIIGNNKNEILQYRREVYKQLDILIEESNQKIEGIKKT
jgi:hypothetical protein